MFNEYYVEELAYLRELGREFSRANPAMAAFLGEAGSDPDVERLLEGFAFLTARIREKLADELPELTQSLFEIVCPQYLRPVPAMTIEQFEPRPTVLEALRVPRGTEVDSVPIDGTSCRFRTCYDVLLLPISIDSVATEVAAAEGPRLRVVFRLAPGAEGKNLSPERIRLYLHGESANAHALWLQLTQRLRRVLVRPVGGPPGGGQLELPPDSVRAVGFAEDEALLEYPRHVFSGYRLIQEYFSLPEKFLFVDVTGTGPISGLGIAEAFEVVFELSAGAGLPTRVDRDAIRLHCTPAVNLLPIDSDPIRVNQEKVEYLVRAGGSRHAHFQVYSVDRVRGFLRGTAEPRTYLPFYSFRHGAEQPGGDDVPYHVVTRRGSVLDRREKGQTRRRFNTYLTFVDGNARRAMPPTETVVAELTCTNADLPRGLRVGDVARPTGSSPEFATFRNITGVMPPVVPPLEGDVHWRLISNLSLNHLSLGSPEALRQLLDVYNFRALDDAQAAQEQKLRLAGILQVRTEKEMFPHQGAWIPGVTTHLELAEESFGGEGGMVLFARVLEEFLALYSSLNSLSRLVVTGAHRKEVYRWGRRFGRQTPI